MISVPMCVYTLYKFWEHYSALRIITRPYYKCPTIFLSPVLFLGVLLGPRNHYSALEIATGHYYKWTNVFLHPP
jgi:hypothetical protein